MPPFIMNHQKFNIFQPYVISVTSIHLTVTSSCVLYHASWNLTLYPGRLAVGQRLSFEGPLCRCFRILLCAYSTLKISMISATLNSDIFLSTQTDYFFLFVCFVCFIMLYFGDHFTFKNHTWHICHLILKNG